MNRIATRTTVLVATNSAALFLALACSSPSSDDPDAGIGANADADALDARAPPKGDSAIDASATTDAGIPHDAASLVDGTDGSDPSPDAPVSITYTNPVYPQDFPDPFVLTEATTYYAFATNGHAKNIQAAQSADLISWTELPDALPTLPTWAAKNAGLTWAPSVLKRGNGYVMYYTARYVASGFQCISRAVSAAPEGPYVDDSPQPFVCQIAAPEHDCGSIDPSPFVDGNGTPYLVWKSDENASQCATAPRLWSAPLSADGLTLAGPATALLTMDQPWEEPIIEGPAMTLHAGVYFLFYSANAYESASYSMGYGTCLTAIGPCKKITVSAPFIMSADTALGPGGGEFFTDRNGREWLAYHAWTAPKTTYAGGGARSLRIDPIRFDGGVPLFTGPTTTAQTE